jgi:hypothetical protein
MDPYPITNAADITTVLTDVPQTTKDAIIDALTQNGLLSGNTTVNIRVIDTPTDRVQINGNVDKVVVLAPGAATQINSNKPIVVSASGGDNYLDTSHYGAGQSRDRANTVIGGSGSDTIIGNTARSSLVAGSGSQFLLSGGGRDTIQGGSGDNTLVGGGKSSIVAGSGSSEIIAGQSGTAKDTIAAGSGASTISLGAGNNVVTAPTGGGSATISAGTGYDTISGPAANDGAATINGGGHTTFTMGSGSVTFNAEAGSKDTVFGGPSSGFLNLGQSLAGATVTNTIVDGQLGRIFTFANGGQVTIVGNVNTTFSDTRKS